MIQTKNAAKIFTLMITLGVLITLIISAPAQAYILRLDVSNKDINKEESVGFTATIQLSSQDKSNITSIQLKFIGPSNITCNFKPNGEIIDGCNGITINKTSDCSLYSGYNGYGNCNFGYYGGSELELTYDISYNSGFPLEGMYKTSLSVFSGSKLLNTFSGGNLKVISPVILEVISPQDGDIFGSGNVLVNLSASSKSLFYYSFADNPEKWNKICSSSNLRCSKKIKFKEGVNNLIFKAVGISGVTSNLEEVSITIDGIKPVILKISSNGSISNGNMFSVIYNKNDRVTGTDVLNNVTLFYGIGGDIMSISKPEECLTGMNQHCDFEEVDVSYFEGQNINYWFNISTKANSVLSKKGRVKIDTTSPEIEPLVDGISQIISSKIYSDFKKQVYSRNVKFTLDITEDNFDRVSYVDSNNCGYKVIPSQVLCTRLNVGRCIVTKSFCVGHHNLIITAIDKAGNIGTTETSFDIDP